MLDVESLGDEFVLGADVVVEGDGGKGRRGGRVGRGSGLTVAEQGGDDYEILGMLALGMNCARKGGLCVDNTFFGFRVLSSPISQTLSDIAGTSLNMSLWNLAMLAHILNTMLDRQPRGSWGRRTFCMRCERWAG